MTDDIDYTILGDEMQIVEIGLDPGETVIAEAGAMNYMDEGITFESVMGDGTKPPGGFWDQAFGAGKRVLAGESLFLTHFHNASSTKRTLAFAAPYPGKIIPLDLAALGGDFTCQKDSFLCAAKGTQLDITFTKNIGVGLFGGEGFILERLRGSGRVFVHAGGTVVKKDLAGGRLLVDTGCLVGFTTGHLLRHHPGREPQVHDLRRRGAVPGRPVGNGDGVPAEPAVLAPRAPGAAEPAPPGRVREG